MMEVTAAVIWQGDKFLICQRPRDKYCGLLWEFPGGKIEPAETANYIAVRGEGDPNIEGGAYQQAISILYAVAYTLKGVAWILEGTRT